MHQTEERLDCVDDFLKHQNLELQRVSPVVPCRDLIDFSMLLKNLSLNSYYLCSFPSVVVRSIPAVPMNRTEESGIVSMWVKARFLNFEPNIAHDFDAQPLFELKVTLSVDCSNLQYLDISHIFLRVLNSNEHRPKPNHQGSSAVTVGKDIGNFQNNIFNWTGKTKARIARERHEEVGSKKIEITKDRDWSAFEEQLKAVPHIAHFAILHPDTAEVWVSSAGFEFKEYEDPSYNLKINERDCLLNIFKKHGNVDTKVAVRLLGEKFSFPKDGGYNSETHLIKFANDSKSLAGIAARNHRCIFLGIYSRPEAKRLDDSDSEYQLVKIYNRISDIAQHYQENIFHEAHRVTFTAVFTKPGCYELNNLLFTSQSGQIISNSHQNEEVKLFIRHQPKPAHTEASAESPAPEPEAAK